MLLFDLINRDSKFGIRTFVVLGTISSLSSALVLALINHAAALVSDPSTSDRTLYLLSIFLVIVAIYCVAQYQLMLRATIHVENAINQIRKELQDSIRHCELQVIEAIGRERIYTTMNKELDTIANSSQLFVMLGQSGLLMVFTFAYIAILSPMSFFIVFGSIVVGGSVHISRSKEVRRQLMLTFNLENEMLHRLNDTLDGFKEVKLSRPRADSLLGEFNDYSDQVFESEKKSRALFSKDLVLSQASFFWALGAVAFLVPLLSPVYTEVVIKVTTATLFMFGAINSFINSMPAYATANAAAKNVVDLEQELKAAKVDHTHHPILTGFKSIKMENISFTHNASVANGGFAIGPVNMEIKQGQTIFITGGNGSGKTTFIRVLCGLYQAISGNIRVDDRVITPSEIDAYRNLYTSVFSDFHLFSRLYGIDEGQEEDIEKWLDFLEMSHKVKLHDLAFSTTNLSGGQRKRLALMSSVLENRSIYIFDEWAADQDPYFRGKFYNEILPALKERKQTVIAITHDDKYFDMADVRYKMEDGQLHLVSKKTKGTEQGKSCT